MSVVKVKVQNYEEEAVETGVVTGAIYEYNFDTSRPLEDHLYEICSMYSLPEGMYSLQIAESGTYLYDDDEDPLHEQLDGQQGTLIYIRVAPQARAEECLDILEKTEEAIIKKELFSIRHKLRDAGFAEEFIALGGMARLLEIITSHEGNIQAYALTAVRGFMGYYSGLNEFLDAPDLVDKLFFLVAPGVVGNVCRQAIELLFVLCNYGGFQLVHKAAKFTSRMQESEPYSNIIHLLDGGDFGTQLNALTLLNSLLDNAPSEEKVKKLIKQWCRLGVKTVLFKQAHINDTAFIAQRTRFEAHLEAGGTTLQGPKNFQEMQQLLVQYEQQQPLIKILQAELLYYRQVIREAEDSGANVNIRAPVFRAEDFDIDFDMFDGPLDVSGSVASGMSGPGMEFGGRRRRREHIDPEFAGKHSGRVYNENEVENAFNAAVKATPRTCADDIYKLEIDESFLDENSKADPDADSRRTARRRKSAVSKEKGEVEGTKGERRRSVEFKTELEEEKRKVAELEKQIEEMKKNFMADPGRTEALETQRDQLVASIKKKEAYLGIQSGEKKAGEPGAACKATEEDKKNDATSAPPATPPLPPGEGGPPPPPPPPGGGPPPPPPPPGGGPPPPPPPPGGGPRPPTGNFSKTKPIVKPATKMKPLHWKKIVLKDNQENVWSNLQNKIDLDNSMLEELFCVKKAGKMAKKGKGEGAGGGKDDEGSEKSIVRVLNPKRANAIGIMASRLPKVDAIIKGIRQMDNSILKRDDIEAILANFPEKDEIEAILEVSSPEGRLDFPEQFCLQLSKIPDVRDRLKCWKFQLFFDEEIEDIQLPLFKIEEACKELKKSNKLRQIMALYLEIGNYLNGGSSRGQADGFHVSTLLKLSDTKDITNTITLLEHGVNLIKKHNPDLLKVQEDLTKLHGASLVQLTMVTDDLRKLIMNMKDVRADITRMKEAAEQLGVSDDPFLREMPKFADKATQKVLQVRDLLADVEKLFHETLEYFGVSIEKVDQIMKTEEFFSIFTKFLENFKKVAAKRPQKKKTGIRTGNKVGGNNKEADPMANVINAIRLGKMESAKEALSGEEKFDLRGARSPRGYVVQRNVGRVTTPRGRKEGDSQAKDGPSVPAFSQVKLKKSTRSLADIEKRVSMMSSGSQTSPSSNPIDFKANLKATSPSDASRNRSGTTRVGGVTQGESDSGEGLFKVKLNKRRLSTSAMSKNSIVSSDDAQPKSANRVAGSSSDSPGASLFKVKLNKREMGGGSGSAPDVSSSGGEAKLPPPIPPALPTQDRPV